MSDTVKDPIDLDSLTDDQVNALGPDEIQALMNQESAEEDVLPEEPIVADPVDPDETVPADQAEPETELEDPAEPETAEEKPVVEPTAEELEQQAIADATGTSEAKADPAPVTPKEKTEEPKAEAKPKEDTVDLEIAADFYSQITKPFKADGKDFSVKTPEEAVRLIQMGANYSRRMQELKPMKAMDAMLREHGLNDPKKLSELIDISKGNPEAIQKLLKVKGIDPLDIDVTKDTGYVSPDFQSNPKDLAYQEAIDNTVKAPGGGELIADMNNNWDEESKQALYEQPTIFENMLAQKDSGVYSKINTELTRQRTLGFLENVPFLQAYHQVGDAMQKAGVFGKVEAQSEVTAPVAKPAAVPIDTGTRKPLEKKTQPANPILSSTPPTAGPEGAASNEPDYSTMSDEDFMKLGAPS
jgi:hypothetical protein